MGKLILDLCGGTGAWSKPYLDAGYEVRVITLPDRDVRDFKHTSLPYSNPQVHGILAAPPCTVFAASGARWERTPKQIHEALSIVDACLRIIYACNPVWWALENPVGSLRKYIGPPAMAFDPCDYGDPYTKRTLLWGKFNPPVQQPVTPTSYGRIHWAPGIKRADRATWRSITPPGFATAFFQANP